MSGISLFAAGTAVLVLALAGCDSAGRSTEASDAHPSSTASRSSSATGEESSGGSGSGSGSSTVRPGPTYQRSKAKGIYLNVLPSGSGGGNDPLAGRVKGPVAVNAGPVPLGEKSSVWNVYITGSDETSVNRWVRITGPDRADFLLTGPDQQDVGTAGFFCDSARCTTGLRFAPHELGRRSATLAIGEVEYTVTGTGVPARTPAEPGAEEPSTPSPTDTTQGE